MDAEEKQEPSRPDETLFRAIVQQAPDAVLMVNRAGRIVFANQQAERLFGYTHEELIGSEVEMLVPEAIRAAHERMRHDYNGAPRRRGMAEGENLQGQRKDGSLVALEIGLSPCTYEGEPHVVASALDVSKRRQSEAALKESEARLSDALEYLEERETHLSNLISSIPDAVITVEEEGVIEEVNAAAASMFGRTVEDFVGIEVESLLAPEVAKAIRTDRRRTEGLDFLRDAAMTADVLRANGDDFRAAITVNGFKTAAGRKYLWIIRDISHELRYEKERQSLVRALEEKNRELESIIYAASHDLRSPLVNLQGFSEELNKSCARLSKLLDSSALPEDKKTAVLAIIAEEVPEALGFIESSSRKMDQLISGLLKLSRIGNSEMQLRRLDMNDLVNEVVRAMQYTVDQAGARIIVDDLPPCLGDSGQINRVFSNLLDNAIKYRRKDRECVVRISGTAKSRESIYAVEDNGQGVPADYRAKVFEVFHRLYPSAATKGEGLGLAIVRRIVDRHNGDVKLEGSEQGGCRFVVTLPAPRLTEIRNGTQRVFHAGT